MYANVEVDITKAENVFVNGKKIKFVEDEHGNCHECIFGNLTVNDECCFECDGGVYKYVELPKVGIDYLGAECPECGEVIEVSNPTIKEPWQCPECETFFEVNINELSD